MRPTATAGPAGGHPYDDLTPDVILTAIEIYGIRCTGAFLALNSYENRVYRVDREDGSRVAAKFYRPGRWSDDAIREEHAFARELADQEIPVVAPLTWENSTLHMYGGFRFAVFPWQPGRTSELGTRDERERLGRYLGRLHRVGNRTRFQHRPRLTVQERGRDSVAFVLANEFVPDYLRPAYESVSRELLDRIEQAFEGAGPVRQLRLHGDCHLSNVLWSEGNPFIVDLDDCLTGPAVQDLWMLLSGKGVEMELELADILSGYTDFMDFDPIELMLVEPLRSLRMLYYSAWLARRWDDPAFPRNFPWFGTQRYWEEQILALREQLALLDEPPPRWERAWHP